MHKIAVIDDFQNVALRFGDWDGLPDAEITVFNDHVVSEDELARRLAPFDILCVMRERTRLTRSLLRRLPNLRMIASTGPWNAAIDIEATDELGITVCGTGTSLTAAGEHTWALIMAAARKLPQELAAFKSGGWQVSVGVDLHGKTLGMLGLGYTGGVAARIARAFGMKVIAWSQNMTPEQAASHGATHVSKDELMRGSDFLSIHVRLSERTRGLVGARELGLMKPGAYLINTARGPIVDEQALVEALRARRIAGAAVDVFEIEPLPADHPFRTLDNFIGTSHLGYVTEQSYDIYYGESVENIRAYIAGEPIRVLTATRREIGYQSEPR
ncbi:D-2-hydroxyacid dehydrogenase family protein [Bordetella bronchialis]|uniref:Hydroxyacid dehydrogenase n=1 Tax=Bordetella bronchialis TaxID=463025 RepID=A0ABN4R5H5_9BORD|nr:D-2-hydroxyacid dehydrogenase family protein [Bordetella bronchialis]ANN67835.1 hydroxyacid dehydrogenase [Bordetella bronchialis]